MLSSAQGRRGSLLGNLLARAGIGVTILEQHSDFLRDFRGDTIHPSTMAVLEELGLLQEFLPVVDFRKHAQSPVAAGQGR